MQYILINMNYSLFIDLDGVLVDFDRGVLETTGKYPREQSPGRMWSILARTDDFYNILEWTDDGHSLWDYVQSFSPRILTGLPRGKWAEPQKRSWCSRELGPDVPVTTCMSREKAVQGRNLTPDGYTPLLVDDRLSLKEAWEEMGGIFIHHTSAENSIQMLRNVGLANLS